jgi:phage terminase large subunit
VLSALLFYPEVCEIAKRQPKPKESGVIIDLGEANEKQRQFYLSTALYTAYGGAKGGGKTHAVRTKAMGGALEYPGIKILILRRAYGDLQQGIIEPIVKIVEGNALGTYDASKHILYFINGSTIRFGNLDSATYETTYQGQEYDWIFMDEATQFTERQFQYIRGCLRGVNDIPKRFYLTCNPGGVGHRWVKRLFIDRDFKTDSDNPEENENPDDYVFIPATIEDNTAMRKYDPIGYKNQLQILSQMPDNLKAAYRYGIWDELGGNYFPEFNNATHVINTKSPDFKYPVGWERFHRYRTFDYGFDMFACYWIAVDTAGRSYVYREFRQGRDNNLPELTASQAAQKILENTLPNENITITYAPPDIWNTQKTDGKTIAEDFVINGVPLVKANNNRVQGHMQIKEMLRKRQDGKPMLYIFDTCPGLISDLRDIQSDEKNPNDCAKDPHDITHSVDALRYYCISRTLPTEIEEPVEVYEEDGVEDYDNVMCGGEVTESYLTY